MIFDPRGCAGVQDDLVALLDEALRGEQAEAGPGSGYQNPCHQPANSIVTGRTLSQPCKPERSPSIAPMRTIPVKRPTFA